ncbi:hypothetical protein IMAU80162_00011 [Lactiplantibacillus plantarum]|nr:hypothetical protein [Lactiplantibacillus plantarum]MCG0864098.1 hypothetical protein [Lactiplantibacillus plantarum]
MTNNMQEPKKLLTNIQSSIEPIGRTAAQSLILNLGEKIPIPIISTIIGVSKNLADDLAQREFSQSVVDILEKCISKIDDLDVRVQSLNDHQKNTLGKTLYYTCVAYDSVISDDKKDYLKELIKSDLLNPANLNLDLQDLYLLLIQNVPTYSLQFLAKVYTCFGTSTVSQFNDSVNDEDPNSQKWLKLKSDWIEMNIKNTGLSLEIETIVEPLILHGLIRQTTFGVIGGTRYIYNVTKVGKSFIEYLRP